MKPPHDRFTVRRAGGWMALVAALLLAGCAGGGSHPAAPGPATPGPAAPGPAVHPTPGRHGLRIAAMHVTQGTQTVDGAVPLVQDRNGCLRVFVLADAWTGPAPAVRVRIGDAAGAEVLDRDLPAPGSGVPEVLRDSAAGQSWDLPLPGRLIQPGMTIRAELRVPPGDPVLASGAGRFPPDGRALAPKVLTVPPLRLTLVPIRAHGRIGRIEEGGRTLASWTDALRAMFPVAGLEVQVAPPFDTPLDLGGPKDVLGEVLDELEAWRLADGRNDDRYVYGVFANTVPNREKTIGMGLQGAPGHREGRTALGHDLISPGRPRMDYAETLVHELGHTFGRLHSPCFAWPSDPDYPVANGGLDACGFDLRTHRPVDPARTTDIMGYCEYRWVSRYTYEAILDFRIADGRGRAARHRDPAPKAVRPPETAPAAREGLLVWGGLKAGRLSLVAALRVQRPPLPPVPGAFRLECLDRAGRVTQAVAFAPGLEADQPGSGGFAMVVPMPPGGEAELAEIRVIQDGAVQARLRSPARKSGPEPRARRGNDGRVHFSWIAEGYPRVLVQETDGGATLALGAGGSLDLRTAARSLDCTFTDGLHSQRRRVQIVPEDPPRRKASL